MALIACSECSKQISDRAAACPHCGNPMRGAPSEPAPIITKGGDTITTQETSKGYKGAQLAGVCLIILGIPFCATGEAGVRAGTAIAFIGLVVFLIARLGAWWDHG